MFIKACLKSKEIVRRLVWYSYYVDTMSTYGTLGSAIITPSWIFINVFSFKVNNLIL